MRRHGLRLRTILVVIATLAVLMGLGATMRPGPIRGVYGIVVPIDQFGPGRPRFDLQRWEVWIPDDPTSVEWISADESPANDPGKDLYVCIPVEYVVTPLVIVALPIAFTIDYLLRRRRRAKLYPFPAPRPPIRLFRTYVSPGVGRVDHSWQGQDSRARDDGGTGNGRPGVEDLQIASS